MHDFGKFSIMSDGVQKELTEGCSWLHIRNKALCDTCIYQWLCPSPSDYEIRLGHLNLCTVKTRKK